MVYWIPTGLHRFCAFAPNVTAPFPSPYKKGKGTIMKSITKSRIIGIIIAVVITALLFWFSLPPIHLRSPEFWTFVIEVLVVFLVCLSFTGIFAHLRGKSPAKDEGRVVNIGGNNVQLPHLSLPKATVTRVLFFCILGIIALMIIASIVGSTLFNAGTYKGLIEWQDGNFADDIAELDRGQIPVVDRDTAIQLGRRKLGEMGATSDLVSQFEISNEYYTQINYKGKPVRVTPLEYADIIKWFNNQAEGIPAYVRVDMVSQETELVRLDQAMKYAPGEYFMRDLKRHLRFNHPTKIFDDSYSFEIDENGTPYWVASTIRYRVGLWSASDVEGAVLVNAITGEDAYYPVDKIPTWVDRVYHADLIIQQLNWNGRFQKGFWNAHFGQSGVLSTTDGYNYIANNDDVFLYTGMTSVTSDQSNVGFVLVNMRTKETKFYPVSGATENSAMGSAQGQVQDLGYQATFPLLLNIQNRPTYFMSLKDGAGMIKMFAYVDVNRYQIVGTGASVEAAEANYKQSLASSGEAGAAGEPTGEEVSGKIAEIHAAVRDGNTRYSFKLEGADTIYTASIALSEKLPFLKAGDEISFTCSGEGDVRAVTAIR